MRGMLGRWLFGTALVSWRYLWMTTPLHRREHVSDGQADLPPALPRELLDGEVQLAGDGVGPLFHRRFTVHIQGADRSAEELMSAVIEQFERFVPQEVVGVAREGNDRLVRGQELVLRMPGPWDGPVRVVEVHPLRLRLATLRGHLEAGQVQFSARQGPEGVTFEIEAWARCATPTVRLLYTRLRLAKEVQLNMWVRFCLSAARIAGGRPRDGVHVVTWRVPQEALPLEQRADGRMGIAEGPPGKVQHFPFRFTPWHRLAAAAFAVAPATTGVTLTPQELIVRYGPWRLRTPRSNIESVQHAGGFSWFKTAGPARMSLADRGITFATNDDHALCLTLREPVPSIEPTGRLRHPGLTLSVADPDALAAALG